MVLDGEVPLLRALDWVVVVLFLGYVLFDGWRLGKGTKDARGYFLAGNRSRWWALGLSVMATQASAITFLSTTGHGYDHGMQWLHVYFALPFAMVLLCWTVVPWFLRARVFTAYEYLERRFDAPTRWLASALFLISRGLAVGTAVYAPSLILSLTLGLPEWQGILCMGGLSIAYTFRGGMAAVVATDVKQMAVMVFGLVLTLGLLVSKLPEGVSVVDALELAGAAEKMEAVRFDSSLERILAEKYNLVSALFGGLFLFLGYFGADQSQVQRFLSAGSEREGRWTLMMSAFLKIPMQFVILLAGVLLFVHYTYQAPPMFFRAGELERQLQIQESPENRLVYEGLRARFETTFDQRQDAADRFLAARNQGQTGSQEAENFRQANQELQQVRKDGIALLKQVSDQERPDSDFVFPHFLLSEMPVGLLGLLIAGVFAAAMSSLDSALSSLATSTVMDLYVPFRGGDLSQGQLLRAGRWGTLFWGVFATATAFVVGNLGPIIEVVNLIGSMFYGSLFGVFMLGRWVPRARGPVGWIALASGFALVLLTHFWWNQSLVTIDGIEKPPIGFLWYNLIGFLGVLVAGWGVSKCWRRESNR